MIFQDYGQFALDGLSRLPPAMQREAALLTVERLGAESPDLPARALERDAAKLFGMPFPDFYTLLDTCPAHSILREDVDEGMVDPVRQPVADAPRVLSRAVVAFAQIHLTADAAATLDVSTAYRRFAAFCAARGEAQGPRAQFGAELLVMAQNTGGRRQGGEMIGLALRPEREAVHACAR